MMLPPIWKTVGYTVAAIVIGVTVGCAVFCPGTFDKIDSVFRDEYALSLVIIALFVAAMSRDRAEDEMLRQIRLASIFHAFCWVTLYVALYPLLTCFLHTPMINTHAAILSMVLIYHTNFILSKWRVRREANKRHENE